MSVPLLGELTLPDSAPPQLPQREPATPGQPGQGTSFIATKGDGHRSCTEWVSTFTHETALLVMTVSSAPWQGKLKSS